MLKLIFCIMSMFLLLMLNSQYLWMVCMSMLFLMSFMMMFMMPMGMNMNLTFNFFFFFDGLSIPLIILVFWVMSLMILSSYKIYLEKDKFLFFMFNLLLLMVVLLMCFSSSNFMIFYIMFEGSLIPTMIMILVWGYQPERLQASMYFMIYTVMASLPLLVSLTMILSKNYSLSMMLMNWNSPVLSSLKSFWWVMLIMAFLAKMPLYTIHLWLPKAHVEAPVAGSMVLAAILLKLGSYGMMRVSILFPENGLKLISLFSSLCMIGACITSAICLRQPDMKSMIAYSSVGHMGFVVIGILIFNSWGWYGALSLMIAHGLCSSALFSIANMVYEYIGSRSVMMIKGLITIFPCMSFWWFILSIANMSAPPTFNLFSEIILLVSILKSSLWYSIMFLIASVLVGAFSLFLFTSSQHGSLSNFINPFNYSMSRNYMILMLHLFPLYFMLLQPYSFFFM